MCGERMKEENRGIKMHGELLVAKLGFMEEWMQ